MKQFLLHDAQASDTGPEQREEAVVSTQDVLISLDTHTGIGMAGREQA